MLRSHNCGELRLENMGQEVQLSGWVQRIRDKGSLLWIDLRDRYGMTQLFLSDERKSSALMEMARELGREYVIQARGTVIERESKNPNMPTGAIEIDVSELSLLNPAILPPFTIEDETDGGDELRMKYRYLDLRRNPLKKNIILRHQLAIEVRKFLDAEGFLEIETPYLIKSTPEGARDFVVPSRMNPGSFYALPQSPQTFKQLLMVAGYDKYFQLVRCFRDEDLRADRQPEFTQIDCELSFVEQQDVLNTFEQLMKHLFDKLKSVSLPAFEVMSYDEAVRLYGTDKPDLRFDMKFYELNDLAKGKGFQVFDQAELVVGFCVNGAADFSRKQLDQLTDFVKRPQIGAKGLVYVKIQEDGQFKSSVDKFYDAADLNKWSERMGAQMGDLMLIMTGDKNVVRKQLNELRLHMAQQLGLRDPKIFKPLWVVDFPLLEWDEDNQRYHAMHHPFTSPKKEDEKLIETNPGAVRANAYDMVINGVEIGGGSIRIHDRELQQKMFTTLGFSDEEAKKQFGFLMDAFTYGAPPHGGIALGFDRLAALFGGQDSIRDFIAFPKNNAGRDVMIDSPSTISEEQLKELQIRLEVNKE